MKISKDDLSTAFNLEQKRTEAYNDSTSLNPEDLKQELEDLMSKSGFSKVGSGDYRVVYGDEDTVAKIAWNQLGLNENKSEYMNWNRIKNTTVGRINGKGTCEAREYVGEIYSCHNNKFGWLLMERIRVGFNNVTPEEADKVRQSFEEAGIHIDEIEPYNMGRCYRKELSEEVPVIFDYGGT